MNALCKLIERDSIIIKSVLLEEQYHFLKKEPAKESDIVEFENKIMHKLPIAYKEFLLKSNGAIIFKSSLEDDGYKLLGISDMLKVTNQLKESGYDIHKDWFCFMQCMFSNDIMLMDLAKNCNYIIDGDVEYPINEWNYLNGDINTFFIHLIQSNGAMFWRW